MAYRVYNNVLSIFGKFLTEYSCALLAPFIDLIGQHDTLFSPQKCFSKGDKMLKDVQAIILAAGKSTRFNTGKTKLVEKVCGQELIIYPLMVLDQLKIPTTVVVGYQRDLIKKTIEKHYGNRVQTIVQDQQQGTGHAVQISKPAWHAPYILIVKGDMPLITLDLVEELYQKHIETQAAITFVSAHSGDPSGFSYSRVVKKDTIITVVDPHELSKEELLEHCCINAGITMVSRSFLESAISHLACNPHTNEFHISNLINMASNHGLTVSMITAPFDHVRDINTFQDLWAVEQIKRSELIKYWMMRGVRFSTAQSVHIDLDVEIGAGTFIGCGVHLLSGTRIGRNCTISEFSILKKSIIGNHSTVNSHTIIKHATLGDHVEVGPFTHIQEETLVHDHAQLGNFVEIKRSSIGAHSKAKHLTYLGDAIIGTHANIGAGTITCNYDGFEKKKTIIEDHAFIGSNNCLVAPVIIHKRAYTAAGSTITNNVPAESLAIARSRQVIKRGYSKKARAAREQQKAESESEPQNKSETISFRGAVKTSNDSCHDS